MADWIISTKTRRQSWWSWMISLCITLLLLIGQTIGGAWEGAVPRAWTWLLTNMIPGLTVLLASLLLNRTPKKMTPPGANVALVGGTIIYGALVLLSLISEGIWVTGNLSAIARLEQTYWWLIPFQLVLLIGYYLAFFRTEAMVSANETIIRNAALRYASDAARNGRPLQEQCRNYIAAAEFDQAFDIMKIFFNQNSQSDSDELLLLQSQYSHLIIQREEGLVDQPQAQIHINRIAAALLNLSEQIKE